MSKKKDSKIEEQIHLAPKFEEEELRPFLHENHKQPKTRREFLAHGFIGVGSTMMLPTFASMVASQNAMAAGCELPTFVGGLPYLCIDVAGGMNIAGSNAIVGLVSEGEVQDDVSPVGATSRDYIRLGISPSEHPSASGKVEDKYGLKFHRASGILDGMNSILDGQMMPNGKPISDGIDGLVFCTRTSDDTATNQINTVYMANKAGAKGELVNLIGNRATDTGGRSAAPGDQVNLTLRPSRIDSYNDAAGLLSLGPNLSGNQYLRTGDSGGQERIKKFMDRIAKMSKTKLDDLAKKSSLGQIQEVLNCSFDNAKQLFQVYSAEQLDPTNDDAVKRAFTVTDDDGTRLSGPANEIAAAKLVLDKIAGAGTITLGGGDYHGGAPANTHANDRKVGQAIGRCILLAKEKGENLAIHLYTDGGVSGDNGGAAAPVTIPGIGNVEKIMWVGDSGTRSSAILLFYKHNHDGSSMVRENSNNIPRRQIGNFVKGGGVQLNTVIGNSTVNLWKAIILNYLAAQGKEGEFTDIFGSGTLPPNYESLIRMKKIMA